MGRLRLLTPGKGPLQAVAPASLDEHRAPERGKPRYQGVDRLGNLHLAGIGPGLERPAPDFPGMPAYGHQMVALPECKGPSQLEVIARRLGPELLHAAYDEEPRLVAGRDGAEGRERVRHRGRVGVVAVKVEPAALRHRPLPPEVGRPPRAQPALDLVP